MRRPAAAAKASPIISGPAWQSADAICRGAKSPGGANDADGAVRHMHIFFFADKLMAGLSLKETHAQWREQRAAPPFQLTGTFLDWMRDGH
eukprot:2804907-Pyramimonas_sp.AAC.1